MKLRKKLFAVQCIKTAHHAPLEANINDTMTKYTRCAPSGKSWNGLIAWCLSISNKPNSHAEKFLVFNKLTCSAHHYFCCNKLGDEDLIDSRGVKSNRSPERFSIIYCLNGVSRKDFRISILLQNELAILYPNGD